MHNADNYIAEFNKLVAAGKGTKSELNALLKSFEASGWGRHSNWADYFAKSRKLAGKSLMVISVLATAASAAETASDASRSAECCANFVNAFSIEFVLDATNADLARIAIEGNPLTTKVLEIQGKESSAMADFLDWENNSYWQNSAIIERNTN